MTKKKTAAALHLRPPGRHSATGIQIRSNPNRFVQVRSSSRKRVHRKSWKVKLNPSGSSPLVDDASTSVSQTSEAGIMEIEDVASASEKQNAALCNLFTGNLLEDSTVDNSATGNLLEDSTVDNSAYLKAKIRAAFYPKFENEKSDQEIRTRMIELVSKGLATVEVSLKHSGSLFMYSGHNGGAYAKNSFGNIYTAVGIFVLERMFKEAWGPEANRKQAEFNEFLERNRICISMELVTAVLGDHGQRPRDDYVVVTAITELENQKPRFHFTPEIIAFCRKWRLPTNHVWLFSTRKSVTSFFAAYDALYEEGTATPVCKVLDEVAEISVPGSKDHIRVQGEILEGLVARIVSRDSSKRIEEVLRDHPLPLVQAGLDLGPNLRDLCAANRSEKQQIKAILASVGSSFCPDTVDWFEKGSSKSQWRIADKSVVTKFLQAHPADYTTAKLQEMIRLMIKRRFPAAFKCYYNMRKLNSVSIDVLHYKMVIHVYSDSVFQQYQKEMRHNPGLWPIYRGFFVDINIFKENSESATEIMKNSNGSADHVNGSNKATSDANALADEDANLMLKLKFLTYKLRTFLIRNGLSILFKKGPAAYKTYYMRQMNKWGISAAKQKEMHKMLHEWAVYIQRECGNKPLSSDIYLSKAEPFLEQYAKRSAANQALIGSTGNFVSSEDFLAIVGGLDEECDHKKDREVASPIPTIKDNIPQDEGLIVFFPGIPGCAKSAFCKELINNPGSLGDDRPVQTLMGDVIKGRYWQKIAEERRKKPYSIMLADKNAPNELVWRQIEEICLTTKSTAVPIVPESEGTDSNPFSLDALATFMFRVVQRVNHPGKLDKTCPTAGYVLLMFYQLYDEKNRTEFEGELIERFGSLVKMPLLRSDRNPLPDDVKSVLEDGINLYRLHTKQPGRLDSTKGAYAKEWPKWEKKLQETLSSHVEYLNSIQVPFEFAVSKVLEQLKSVAKGSHAAPSKKRRKLCSIVFAAVTLPVDEILSALNSISRKNSNIEAFVKDKRLHETLRKAHITLAHKRIHGVTAVANYGQFLNQKVPVELTAVLFSNKIAAFKARLGSVDGQIVESENEWPHATIWAREGVALKDANNLPQLHLQRKATRVEIAPPIVVQGEVEFF